MTSIKKKYIKPEVRMIKAEEDICTWGGSKGWGDGNGHYHNANGDWVDEDGNIIENYNPTNWGANNSKQSSIWEEE